MSIESMHVKRILKNKNEDDISEKLKQISEITQIDEEKCFFVLHDCDYNVEVAVDKILSLDKESSEWKKLTNKSKKLSKSQKLESMDNIKTESFDDEKTLSEQLEPVFEVNPLKLSNGRTFKNFQLCDKLSSINLNFKKIPIDQINEYEMSFVWNGKTVIIQNSKYPPQVRSDSNSKKSEEKVSDCQDASIVFKSHCSTKPPPKVKYSLSSAVQIVNKPITNSKVPKFKFGDDILQNHHLAYAPKLVNHIDSTGASKVVSSSAPDKSSDNNSTTQLTSFNKQIQNVTSTNIDSNSSSPIYANTTSKSTFTPSSSMYFTNSKYSANLSDSPSSVVSINDSVSNNKPVVNNNNSLTKDNQHNNSKSEQFPKCQTNSYHHSVPIDISSSVVVNGTTTNSSQHLQQISPHNFINNTVTNSDNFATNNIQSLNNSLNSHYPNPSNKYLIFSQNLVVNPAGGTVNPYMANPGNIMHQMAASVPHNRVMHQPQHNPYVASSSPGNNTGAQSIYLEENTNGQIPTSNAASTAPNFDSNDLDMMDRMAHFYSSGGHSQILGMAQQMPRGPPKKLLMDDSHQHHHIHSAPVNLIAAPMNNTSANYHISTNLQNNQHHYNNTDISTTASQGKPGLAMYHMQQTVMTPNSNYVANPSIIAGTANNSASKSSVGLSTASNPSSAASSTPVASSSNIITEQQMLHHHHQSQMFQQHFHTQQFNQPQRELSGYFEKHSTLSPKSHQQQQQLHIHHHNNSSTTNNNKPW